MPKVSLVFVTTCVIVRELVPVQPKTARAFFAVIRKNHLELLSLGATSIASHNYKIVSQTGSKIHGIVMFFEERLLPSH